MKLKANLEAKRFKLCVSCMACDESIELTEEEEVIVSMGKTLYPKICDKCRKAIMRMRED